MMFAKCVAPRMARLPNPGRAGGSNLGPTFAECLRDTLKFFTDVSIQSVRACVQIRIFPYRPPVVVLKVMC